MRKKYMTEENFEKWKSNDFHHVCKKIARMEGVNWATITFLAGILGIVIVLLSK